MNLKWFSLFAPILMIAGLVWAAMNRQVFAASAWAIAPQVGAALLMLWARVTFGVRSFHAMANPTRGGLVTTGPYRYVRHPIYAAVLYFMWAAALDHRTRVAVAAAVAVTVGAAVRMLAEERLLLTMYPEYTEYRARTARVVPFLI